MLLVNIVIIIRMLSYVILGYNIDIIKFRKMIAMRNPSMKN